MLLRQGTRYRLFPRYVNVYSYAQLPCLASRFVFNPDPASPVQSKNWQSAALQVQENEKLRGQNRDIWDRLQDIEKVIQLQKKI